MSPFALLASGFAGAAAALLAWGLWALNREVLDEGRRSFGGGAASEELPRGFAALVPYARALAALVRPAFAGRPGRPLRESIRLKLLEAGNPGELEPEEVVGLSLACGAAGTVSGAVLGWVWGVPSWGTALATGAGLAGAILPWSWLADRAKVRLRGIQKEFPYAIDLMTLSMEVGLDFVVAIERVAAKLGNTPLGKEFSRFTHEVRMGKSRREALGGLQERIRWVDVDFFVGALVQAEELGTGLVPTLRVQGEGIRERRFLRAEEMAMKAPVKILFPLIVFILPATLVVILGPLGIQLWRQFSK